MNFKYTAIGTNNQKLEGILEAESLDAARDQLHKMSLSIIAINEMTDAEAAQMQQQPQQAPAEVGASSASGTTQAAGGITTYFFSAEDAQQKTVNGTIDASDPESAFRRLFTEYHFKVMDIYPNGNPDPVASSFKSQFPEWISMLESEGVDMSYKQKSGSKGELEEAEEGMSEEIVAEIDQFIINTKKIMTSHKNQYSEAFFREITKTLDELERIRSSNNLKHITKICNNLYELIAHPDSIKTEEAITPQDEEYEKIVSTLKGSGFVSNQFAFLQAHSLKKKSARFDKVQKAFAKILGALNSQKGAAFNQKLANKKKGRHAKWIAGLADNLSGNKGQAPHVTLKKVLFKFFDWMKASNVILRRARKQEFIASIHEWRAYKAKVKADKLAGKSPIEGQSNVSEPASNYSAFYMEVDSFVGWLLFFYITYFFLASFSLEKNLGLPQELVLKTFNSPLLINICIFLVVSHLALTLKLRFFRGQILSSIFLFCLSLGIYTVLVLNF